MEYKDIINLFCIQHTQSHSETALIMLLWFIVMFIIVSLVLSVLTFIGIGIMNWIVKRGVDKK